MRSDVIHNHYNCVWNPEHPKAYHDGYVYEHIIVAERVLGRRILNECIHHRDGNKLNNVESNLLIFRTVGDHTRFHKLMEKGLDPEIEEVAENVFICKIKYKCKFCGLPIERNKNMVCRKCYINNKLQLARADLPSGIMLKQEYENGLSYLALASKYNTSYQTIRSRIRKGI